MGFRNWAAALGVAMFVAGCGGGGGDGDGGRSTPQPSVTLSPSSVVLTASTVDAAPSAAVGVSVANAPDDGLYLLANSGTRGYVTTSFDGYQIIVTGLVPGGLAVGTYTDTITVEVCYDAPCKRQIPSSPLRIPVTYKVTLGDPATATPTVSALSPTTAPIGSAAFTLALSGTNFVSTSQVIWDGQVRPSTYVSPTQLTTSVSDIDLSYVHTSYVMVSNGSTGGGGSTLQPFNVTQGAPTITSLSPTTAALGGSPYTLTVNGSGFDNYSQVTWNGSPRATIFASASRLTMQVTAADIALAGVVPVTVMENSGNLVSNAMNVTVAPAPLALGSVLPTVVAAHGPAFVETLLGTGFDATSVVQWNGVPRATTFVSTTQLKVQVSAADIAAMGSATLQVVNTGANAGASAARTLTIGAASTAATAVRVNPQHDGAAQFLSVLPPSAWTTAPKWTAFLGGTTSYPLIAGGRVFVTVAINAGSVTHQLVALNASTGDVLWGPVPLSGAVNATYDDGRLMVLSSNGVMTGFDASTGNTLWSTKLPFQYSFSAPPTAANGMVFTGGAGSGGTLYGLDDTTGALVWTASVENGDASSPTVTADGVYVSYPCQTYDFAPQNGFAVWHDAGPCEGGGGATGSYANGVYYSPDVPGFGTGTAFDAEAGTRLSTLTVGVAPAFDTASGYIVQNSTLTAIDLATQAVRWAFPGDVGFEAAPVVVNGYVFAASRSGRLYALDKATGATVWQATLSGTVPSNGFMQLDQSGMSAGEGLLLVPGGNTLQAWTLSNNP